MIGLVVGNLLVRNHVRAMTRFVEGGERTAPPEELGWLQIARVLLVGVTIPKPANQSVPALPFETHLLDVDGQRVEVWRVAPERPRGEVVLFHGYAGSKDTLLPVAPVFLERGFAVSLVDFRGHGGSEGNRTTLSVREARDVEVVARWAARRPGPLVLYGFSMGGAAVSRAVARGAPADAVIVESVFDRLSTTVKRRFHRLGLPGSPGAQLLLAWGSVELGASAFAVAPVEDVARIRVPLMVIGGVDDPRVTPEDTRRLARAGGVEPVLREGGHALGASVDPSGFAAAVDRILLQVRSRGSNLVE